MIYKNLRLRYKFGIIFTAPYLIISIISLFEYQNNQGSSDMGTLGYWFIMILGLILIVTYDNQYEAISRITYNNNYEPNGSEFFSLAIFIIENAILYFIVGYLVGLIIEEIKKNK